MLSEFLVNLTLPDTSSCEIYCRKWSLSDSQNNQHNNQQSDQHIFCVHGLTRNGADFEKFAISAAEKGFTIISVDMPGRGKSPRLSNPVFYNNAVNAILCIQLLAKLAINNVFWLGTSMGGIVGMLIANQLPGIIRKMVLNDVGCIISHMALAKISSYVSQSPNFATFSEAENLLRQRTQGFAIPDNEWQNFAKNSIESSAGGFRLAYDPAIAYGLTVPASESAPLDLQLWPLWEAVKLIPTLLIRGEQSDLLSEETAQLMQATHNQLTRYNVANAGHAPALMTTEEITALLNFFA